MKIFSQMSAGMDYLAKTLPRGNYWLTSGIVRREDLDRIKAKFEFSYGTRISPASRHAHRAKGRAVYLAIACPEPGTEGREWRFFLLRSDGTLTPHAMRDKWLDAREVPVCWGPYRMRRYTRPRELGGGTHWSWFLDETFAVENENHLVHLAKQGNAAQLATQLGILGRHPRRFHGISRQLSHMVDRARSCWMHSWPSRPFPADRKSSSDPNPHPPTPSAA